MHITENALINAACMADTMRIDQPMLDAWGHGCVELYSCIGDWATIITEEETHLSEAIDEAEDSWAGVFAYEVTEQITRDIAIKIRAKEDVTAAWLRERTREQVIEFCRVTDPNAKPYDHALAAEVMDGYLTRSKAANA